jgi:2,3-bisphosphoglycerate-dependent phosphoglycerate mutase
VSQPWILIRHGRTAHNRRRLMSGQDDVPLDYHGRWQAIRAGLALRSASPPPLLLCSDLPRARQSAAAIAVAAGWPGTAAWALHPALRERDLGRWHGCSYDALRAAGHTERLIRWRTRPPGGESLAALARRLFAHLSPLPDQPGIIVAHAGPIRVLLGLAQGLPRDRIGILRVPQATPLRLVLPPGGWSTVQAGISRS